MQENLYLLLIHLLKNIFKIFYLEEDNVRDYLIDRGLSDSTIENFNIGFSPDLKNSFYKNASENGFSIDYLN